MTSNIKRGDLIMFRRPNYHWHEHTESYLYGMVIKEVSPGYSWNKSKRLKYNILLSSGDMWNELNIEKIIVLASSKKSS